MYDRGGTTTGAYREVGMDEERFEVGKAARGRVLGEEFVTRAFSTADSFNL